MYVFPKLLQTSLALTIKKTIEAIENVTGRRI